MKRKVHKSEIIAGANHQINATFITLQGDFHLILIFPMNLHNNEYLYISIDGGANYTKAGLTADTSNDVRLETNPKTEGDLWVPIYGQSASANGLYHSINSGTTFTKIPNVQQATSVSLGREEPDKQYPTIYFYGLINNKWGVYQSTDTAKTWVKINDSLHQYGWIDFVVADERTFGRVYLSPNCMGVPYSQLKYDCHGDSGGTAYSDWCGECVGGKTGKISTCLDCKGDTNGTAFKDSCGRCVGGNTGLYPCSPHDCAGVFNGTAHFDSCGICIGGNTGKISCSVDCNKVPEGTAYKDSCNVCVGGNTGKKPCITSVSNTVDDIFEFYPNPFTNEMNLKSKVPCDYPD